MINNCILILFLLACLSVCLHFSFSPSVFFTLSFTSKVTDYVSKLHVAISNLAHSSIAPTLARSSALPLSSNYPSNYYCNNILNHSRVHLSCWFFFSRCVLLFSLYFISIRNCYLILLLQQLLLLLPQIHFRCFSA